MELGYRRVPGATEGVGRAIWRRFHVWIYNLLDLRHRYAGRWKRSIFLLIIQAGLVMAPNVLAHPALPKRSFVLLALAVLASNAFLVVEVNAQRTQKIGELKNERKIRTSTIIDTLGERFQPISMTDLEVRDLRQQMLLAISSSVASSLGMEPNGFTASLLVESGSNPQKALTVIARSTNERPIDISYPKEGMLAWEAIERKQVQVTGDVSKEYEGFASRPYKSVISFPMIVKERAIAALNIDHAFRFLFDERGLLFQTNLRPYLRLIALSLTNVQVQGDSTVGEGDAR
jgi:hypothetical protein